MRTFKVIDSNTGKEANPAQIALNEEWAKNLIYCDIDGFFIGEDEDLILVDDCGNSVSCDRERFKVIWEIKNR